MHSPRPYGLSVEGGELTEQDQAFIQSTVLQFTNFKDTSQLESLRNTYDLPDGGYCVVQDMGGVFKCLAYKPYRIDETFKFDGLAKLYVPMFYSGIVTKAKVRQEEGVSIRITEQCRRRLTNYSNENLPAKELHLKRFIVEPNASIVPEFIPQDNFGDSITTQYVQQRPTWYSGSMAEVMQIVGGYGQQDMNILPDTPLERAQLNIPGKYIERIKNELDGVRLPGYSGIPPLNGEFQFDYKFSKTNGITFDQSNQPWLTQVSSSGVYAMPLPLIPATTTRAFYEFVEETGDEELMNMLDRFGGMPSGEGFPQGLDFESWRRAGVIIKVCSTAEFYKNSAYSNACGWSFNLNGTEGFNTCYTYNDQGIIVGKSFMLGLYFEAAINRGWLRKVTTSPENSQVIGIYLDKLFSFLQGDSAQAKAIMYKLRRVDQDNIYQRALTRIYDSAGVSSNEIDYWDNLELEPIANLSGRINKVAEGYLYHDAKPKFQPQIKFPSVEIGGCISFDFSAYNNPAVKPNCDTIMYGYYNGDNLKVIKYFVDWRNYYEQVESNFDPVMTVGSWKKIETTGNSSPQGHFYTTDLDFREIFSPSVTTTTIKGEDKGFDSQPYFSFDYFFAMPGSIWRNRYYTHLTKSNTIRSEAINLGICIPYFNRNAAILAKWKVKLGETISEGYALYSMADPTSYRYWTYDSVFAWSGTPEKMTGRPYPKNGNPVWVEVEKYNPSAYSDFADQGSWLPGLPYDIVWLIHPNVNEWKNSGGGGPPKVKEYSFTNIGPASENGAAYLDITDIPVTVHSKVPDNWYFSVSPKESGFFFYRDACKVVFGNSTYANISETDQNNRRYKWGYCSLVEDKSAYHFIGVINE